MKFNKLLTIFFLISALLGCGGQVAGYKKFDGPNQGYSTDDLYRFFAVAFGAAPGVTYGLQLIDAANAGMSLKAIVNAFTAKSQFTDIYPLSMGNVDFATKLVNNVVGASATDAAKQEAINDIVSALNLPGWTRGDVIYVIFNNLASKPPTDAKWFGVTTKMAKQVAYAKYYTETLRGDTTEVDELRKVMTAVLDTDTTPNLRTRVITGRVYERVNSIAYKVDGTPENGLKGAHLSILGLTTTTDGNGDFIIRIPQMSDEQFANIVIDSPGYITSQYALGSDQQTLLIGLYPTSQNQKIPKFTKAIVPHDLGGWLMGAYGSGYFPGTFDRIQKMNANTVVYADSVFINQLNFSTNIVEFKGQFFPPDTVVMDMGSMAKSRGLNFMMMIGIYPGEAYFQEFYKNIYTIQPSNAGFWDAWFSAYKKILIERSVLATKAGATSMAIGFNLGYMVDKGNDRWASLISAIRDAGFKGDVSYFSGTNQQYNDLSRFPNDQAKSQFLNLFDQIGIDIYNPVFATNSESLSSDQTIARLKASIQYQIDNVLSSSTPVYLMIGTPSVHGGAVNSDYVEPGMSCDNYKGKKIKDHQQQADIYQAASQIINAQSSPKVRGLFTWGYHYTDNPRTLFTQNDVCFDLAASIRNKPAESLLKYWFAEW